MKRGVKGMEQKVLIVEDEETLRNNLSVFLQQRGYRVTAACSGKEAVQALEREDYDILLTDIYLRDIDGIEVLRQIQRLGLDTTPLVMTAYASVESAIEAFRCGAHDYLLKPFSFDDLSHKLGNISTYRQVIRENRVLRARLHGSEEPANIIYRSEIMRDLVEKVRKLAALRCNVLITGESGVGKELVARALHDLSTRHEQPFLAVNVASIPEELMESHLFGHRRGAFTGATEDREGLFRSANGGTLFLDEIGELPLTMQAKLLRAVEQKEIMPVGSDRSCHVDVRIVTATHRNLEVLVDEGRFRQDLLMRLDVARIEVPPLRARKEDIPLLARHFLARHAASVGKPHLTLSHQALHVLLMEDWSRGNVRELSNAIERAVINCDEDVILPRHLGPICGNAPCAGFTDLRSAVRDFERRYIQSILESTGGDRDKASKILGISVSTLYRHLQ